MPVEADERGNAIEQFERRWRASVARYSAGGIGIGRYSERFSLVRTTMA